MTINLEATPFMTETIPRKSNKTNRTAFSAGFVHLREVLETRGILFSWKLLEYFSGFLGSVCNSCGFLD